MELEIARCVKYDRGVRDSSSIGRRMLFSFLHKSYDVKSFHVIKKALYNYEIELTLRGLDLELYADSLEDLKTFLKSRYHIAVNFIIKPTKAQKKFLKISRKLSRPLAYLPFALKWLIPLAIITLIIFYF